MTIEESLVAGLIADSAVNARISGRIYPSLAPQEVDVPFVVYQVISSVPLFTHDGPVTLKMKRVQIASVDNLAKDVRDLAGDIEDALDGFTGVLGSGVTVGFCQMENEEDDYEPDTRFYIRRQDYMIYYVE